MGRRQANQDKVQVDRLYPISKSAPIAAPQLLAVILTISL